MMRYFDSLEDEMKVAPPSSPESQVHRVIATTDLFLADLERLIMSATTIGLNHHQLIHVQELTKNCLRALIAIAQALLLGGFGGEEKDTQTIQLHPDLCGLLRDADRFWGHSGHQNMRIPYSPSRVGHEVTYEEIANLFRTSRVNIRRVEHVGCFRKLRVKLQAFRITEA